MKTHKVEDICARLCDARDRAEMKIELLFSWLRAGERAVKLCFTTGDTIMKCESEHSLQNVCSRVSIEVHTRIRTFY